MVQNSTKKRKKKLLCQIQLEYRHAPNLLLPTRIQPQTRCRQILLIWRHKIIRHLRDQRQVEVILAQIRGQEDSSNLRAKTLKMVILLQFWPIPVLIIARGTTLKIDNWEMRVRQIIRFAKMPQWCGIIRSTRQIIRTVKIQSLLKNSGFGVP